MLTAEEFLNQQEKGYLILDKKEFTDIMDKYAILKAKLHVEAALKAASKIDFDNVGYEDVANDYEEARDMAILNAYPLNNII